MCVSVEHTASWYVLSFNARDNRWSVYMLESEPNVVCTPCNDERQRLHTALSPQDTRTSGRSRAECCRRTPGSAAPRQQSAQLYRPASLYVSAASHHHHISERRGSSILAALETFESKRRTCVLASELRPRPPSLS